MKRSRLASALTAIGLSLLTSVPALAGTESKADQAARDEAQASLRVVTLGDSWSDAGTFGMVFGTQPGEAWPQILARHFGDTSAPYLEVPLPPAPGSDTPTILGGYDYAEGGARVGIEPGSDRDDSFPRSMKRQLAMHLARAGDFSANDLVLVWGGGNDVVRPYGEGPDVKAFLSGAGLDRAQLVAAKANVDAAVAAEVSLLKDALAHGARRVVVLDLIDLALTDFTPGLDRPGLALAGKLSRRFNRKLARALPRDSRVLFVPISRHFDAISRDPARFGYTVIDGDACKDGSYSCGPDAFVAPGADRTYAFAGYGHFTAKTRELIADQVLGAVLEKWPNLRGALQVNGPGRP